MVFIISSLWSHSHLKVDVGWFLVQSNSHRLQFFLQQSSLYISLASVQHHQDDISCTGYGYHLTTTPLSYSMHVIMHMTNTLSNES